MKKTKTKTKTKRKKQGPKFSSHHHISKKSVARMVRRLIRSGQILSNIAYDLKQNKSLRNTGQARRLDIWQSNWEDARDYLPRWISELD